MPQPWSFCLLDSSRSEIINPNGDGIEKNQNKIEIQKGSKGLEKVTRHKDVLLETRIKITMCGYERVDSRERIGWTVNKADGEKRESFEM